MAITQVSNSLVKQDLTISGGTVDNTVIGSGTPAAGTFTTIAGTLASTVTGTTAAASDNSTKIATTAYVTTALANLVDSAPGTLNTLNELAAALGDDANFATTVTNSIAAKLPLTGGTLTGALTVNSGATNTTATFISSDAGAGINLTDDSGTSTLQTNGANLRIGVDEAGAVSSSAIQFRVDGSTKATLNSNGVLMVGKTSSGLANTGVEFESGQIKGTAANQTVAYLNRTGSDGDIIQFRKDNTPFGEISKSSTRFTIEGPDNPVRIATGTSNIQINHDTHITFDTAGSEAVRIDSSGNVGIGLTTGISSKLHVNNQIVLGPDASNYGIINYGSNANQLTFGTKQSGTNYFDTFRITNGKVIIGGSTTQGGGLLTLEGADAAMLTLHRTADTGDQEILFYDHGDHNATIIGKSGGHLQLRTNGRSSTTMVLTHGGNVGIRTTNPKGLLHVKEADSGMGSANGNFDKLVLEDSSHSGMTILGGANTHGAIYFGDPDVNDVGQIKYKHNDDALCLTTNSQERWKIDSGGSIRQGGSINFMNSALTSSKFWIAKSRDILGGTDDHAVYYTETGIHHQFWLGGARSVNIMNGGITFGTDTAAADTLDDYEEGTYDTQFYASSSGSITMGAKTLAYTKVGRLVTVSGYCTVNSVSSPSGYLYFILPFAMGSGNQFPASASVSFNGLNSGNLYEAWAFTLSGSTQVRVYVGTTTGASATFAQRVRAGTDVRISVTYSTTT